MPSNSERSLYARAAVHASWANTPDRAARTAPARAALWRKYLDQADGDPVRAEHLRRAHIAKMQALALKARRAKVLAARASQTAVEGA